MSMCSQVALPMGPDFDLARVALREIRQHVDRARLQRGSALVQS